MDFEFFGEAKAQLVRLQAMAFAADIPEAGAIFQQAEVQLQKLQETKEND